MSPYSEPEYYAIGPNFERVRDWCWRNNVDVRNVRYIFSEHDLFGKPGEYKLIIFEEYITRYPAEFIDRIREYAQAIYRESDTPIAAGGKITGWKNKK